MIGETNISAKENNGINISMRYIFVTKGSSTVTETFIAEKEHILLVGAEDEEAIFLLIKAQVYGTL